MEANGSSWMLIITCWTYILLIAILHQIISILLVYHFVVVLFKMSTMYTSINNWDSMSIGTRPTFQMSCAKMILDVSITNVCVCVCVCVLVYIDLDRWSSSMAPYLYSCVPFFVVHVHYSQWSLSWEFSTIYRNFPFFLSLP